MIETAKLDNFGNSLRSLLPATPATLADRDRAQGDVRTAEAELLRAYNRLTANVLPRPDEILQNPATDPSPPVRGRRPVKLPKTPAYYERIGALEADISQAQERLDRARAHYYALN